MAVTGFELIEVAGENITADLLVWRRYRRPAPGIVEIMVDANPQISYVHRYTPFLPPGLFVRMPIDPDLLAGQPQSTPLNNLWTDNLLN